MSNTKAESNKDYTEAELSEMLRTISADLKQWENTLTKLEVSEGVHKSQMEQLKPRRAAIEKQSRDQYGVEAKQLVVTWADEAVALRKELDTLAEVFNNA